MSGISVTPSFPVIELWQAAYSGDVLKLQQLLADPEVKNNVNYTLNSQYNHSALFFACYGVANAETIRLLINAGADPFMRDTTGCLPLHLASHTQDPALIAALLEVPNMRGYRLDAATSTGQTPLHALFLPNFSIVSVEKSKNADLSKCLSLFLEVGLDPLGALHKQDYKGVSSIMLVKHYNLQTAFHAHVPARTFDILLNRVSVPANIEDLLKTNSATPSLQYAFDNFANSKTNCDAAIIHRPSFMP